MNVLHVTSSYPRRDDDHVGIFVADLVAAERDAGLTVAVVAPHDRALARDEVIGGAPVHRFRYAPERWEVLSYRGGLMASSRGPLRRLLVPFYVLAMTASTTVQVRRTKADVIHAHWWLPGGVAALVASRLTGVPYVLTLHGSDVVIAARPGLRGLARWVARGATCVTAVSHALAVDAAATLRGPAIDVGPMPVPSVGALPAPLPPAPPPPPLRLLAVGRLTPEKGFDVLAAAVERLAAAGVDVELTLVGDGPGAPQLKGRPHVRLLGAVAPSALPALMAPAHAVVVPSRREGLGLIAVEALAAGRPVVASRVGGLVETVEPGADGLLVAPDDPVALADALMQLPLPPPTARQIERHRPSQVAAEYAARYDLAVAAGAPRRWRPLRWLGALTAVAVVAVLVRVAVHDWPSVRQAWRHPDAAALTLAILATIATETGFGLASAGALSAVARLPAPRWRVASFFWVSQMSKNIPGGVWTALARAGLAANWGIGPRATIGWLSTEALASVAAGTVVGSGALAIAAAGGPTRLPVWVWVVLAVAALLAPLLLVPASPIARVVDRVAGAAPTPRAVAIAALGYVPVWALGAAAFAALCRTVAPLDGRELLLVGGAACIASVAGFVVVPVPSGLGVREAVLVALVHPVLPTAVAASLTLASRVLAIVVQTALAAVALPAARARPPVTEGG